MFHCVLYQPEIPPNTGNIIRLCANSGVQLHLIHPLGFVLDDQRLRRAGLDYHEYAALHEYSNWEDFFRQHPSCRIFACSTRGTHFYSEPAYRAGDMFLFGPETRGLPQTLLNTFLPEYVVKIPMRPDSRSLNLSNAVAVMIYEAWRQNGFSADQ